MPWFVKKLRRHLGAGFGNHRFQVFNERFDILVDSLLGIVAEGLHLASNCSDCFQQASCRIFPLAVELTRPISRLT